MDRLETNRDLPALLRDVIRPARAAASERLSYSEALQAHPEIAPAHETQTNPLPALPEITYTQFGATQISYIYGADQQHLATVSMRS